MANIMSQFRLSNKPRRNGFDLSRKHCFTASAGQLLPVFVEEVLPGDKFKINLDSFTRTQPLNTAAFARMREYYDLFFVPYHILWSHFPSMITQVPNATVATSVDTPKQFTEVPWCSLGELVNPSSHLKYYIEHYQSDVLNILDRFSLLDDGYIPASQTSIKLLDMLGYGASDWISSAKDSYMNVAVSPFRLLAYQKIYADFFRSQQWEDWKPYQSNLDFIPTNNPAGANTYHYKIAEIFGVGGNTPNSATWNKEHPATMRYCNLHKDLFLGVLPNSQFGNESVVQLYDMNGKTLSGELNLYDVFGKLESATYDAANKRVSFNTGQMQTDSNGTFDMKNINTENNLIELSVLALRKAEALQKYKEITQSNDYDYRSQIEAHFGIKPDRGLSHVATWLGGCVNNIGIDSVTNSNFASDATTIIKGKATAAGQNHWQFDSNDYGVIMCIYHCEPLIDYPCHLEKKACLIDPTDFPIPEFDQIGMETFNARFAPLPEENRQLYNLGNYGYVPRYAQFKTSTDYVTGDFNTIEKQWTIPYSLRLSEYDGTLSSNPFRNGFTYLTLKCSPDILDNIFTFGTPSAIGEWNNVNRVRKDIPDQFLCNTYWDTKVVRNLDRDGLPY